MGQIIKVQRPVSPAPINGLYHRPLCDIRGRIYNSFAGGIIAQSTLSQLLSLNNNTHVHLNLSNYKVLPLLLYP